MARLRTLFALSAVVSTATSFGVPTLARAQTTEATATTPSPTPDPTTAATTAATTEVTTAATVTESTAASTAAQTASTASSATASPAASGSTVGTTKTTTTARATNTTRTTRATSRTRTSANATSDSGASQSSGSYSIPPPLADAQPLLEVLAEAKKEQRDAQDAFAEALAASAAAVQAFVDATAGVDAELKVQESLEADRTQAQEAAKQAVINMYMEPDAKWLNWVLESGNLQEAIERADSAHIMAGAQRRAVNRFGNQLKASKTREAEHVAAQEKATKDQSDAQGAGQLALVAYTNAQMKEAAASTGARLTGRFIFPIVGDVTFRNDWGDPRSGGRRHKGTDVFASYGQPLVACENGTLTSIGLDDLGGLGFFLVGESGIHYYYAHLSALAPGAFEGEAVRAGDLVGYVGDSGNAQGGTPHLHFQVHPDGGEPVNPYPLLAAAQNLRPAPTAPSSLPRQGSQATSEFVTTKSTVSGDSGDYGSTESTAPGTGSSNDNFGTLDSSESTTVSTLRPAAD